MAFSRSATGQITGVVRERLCLWCGVSLAERRADARWCSVACRTYYVRRERRRKAVLDRPRCVICNGPMPYRTTWRGPGVRYSATTCSHKCHVRRQTLRRSMLAA